jgi:hypothetical protein
VAVAMAVAVAVAGSAVLRIPTGTLDAGPPFAQPSSRNDPSRTYSRCRVAE